MSILHDLFDPIPLVAMIAIVFALAAFMVIAKFFKMPPDFPIKEQIRDELRFRITNERRANLSEDDANAPLEAAGESAAEPTAEPAAAAEPDKKEADKA